MQKRIFNPNLGPEAKGPYSSPVMAGNLVFTAGQIPISPGDGKVVGSTIEEQTKQVLENLKALLEEAGSGLERVIKNTVFLSDMDSFAKMNNIYAKYFSTSLPARSCVEVSKLPMGVMVEIESVALLKE